jgi:non-ribosomal peptide synthetase component F
MVLVLQACISGSRALVPSLPEAVFCLRYAQSRDFYICLRINRNVHKENFEYQVRRNPKAVALIFESKEYTYGDIDEQANRVANWAIEQGIKPKDTVALLMPVWCFFVRSFITSHFCWEPEPCRIPCHSFRIGESWCASSIGMYPQRFSPSLNGN